MKIENLQKKIKTVLDFKKEIEKVKKKTVTELMEVFLGGAVALEASDLHLEPEEKKVRIRIRIDGILQEVSFLDLDFYPRVLSRIKILSGLKINITDRPQDGRFSILIDQTEIEIRVSTLPAEYGEAVVMRILNPKSLIEIEKLGIRKDLLEMINKEIKRKTGMVIVTGPTGSGKTTTLYAILKKIYQPEIKIITIEDPIEYHLKGISQTQVSPKKGYDFATGLRSIMRQDPDVVLVGEIRDLDTAKIALQAAMTGHLVLTTLHTNDAAGTVARLKALGEKIQNIAPALKLVLAQRLVRRVCSRCVKFKKPDRKTLILIKKELKGLPKKIVPSFKRIPQAQGCIFCNFTGYRGRIGIFEVFLVDPEMETFILKEPSIAEIRKKAIKKGMVTLYQDGLLKVLQKITTLEEVDRVCA